MELRRVLWVPVLMACASATPKRLVIPEEMRRPLASGHSVAEANAEGASLARTKRASTDSYSFPSADVPKPKTPTSAAAAPGATPAAPKATGPARLVSPVPPTLETHPTDTTVAEALRALKEE